MPGLQFSATWNPDKTGVLFDGTGHSFAEILKAASANQPLPHFALNRNVVGEGGHRSKPVSIPRTLPACVPVLIPN